MTTFLIDLRGEKINSVEGQVSYVNIFDSYPVTEVRLDNKPSTYSLNTIVESFRFGDRVRLYVPKPDNSPKSVVAFEIFREDSDTPWLRRILPSLEKHPSYEFRDCD